MATAAADGGGVEARKWKMAMRKRSLKSGCRDSIR